jgi:hypothetical protein
VIGRHEYNLAQEIPGYADSTVRLRDRQTHATSRVLMVAAAICLIRAAVVPWFLYYYPSRTALSDIEIVATSVLLMCAFVMCSLWSRIAPMLATLAAVLVFAGVCARDWMSVPDLIEQGLISKTLITIALVRGIMNAMISRML